MSRRGWECASLGFFPSSPRRPAHILLALPRAKAPSSGQPGSCSSSSLGLEEVTRATASQLCKRPRGRINFELEGESKRAPRGGLFIKSSGQSLCSGMAAGAARAPPWPVLQVAGASETWSPQGTGRAVRTPGHLSEQHDSFVNLRGPSFSWASGTAGPLGAFPQRMCCSRGSQGQSVYRPQLSPAEQAGRAGEWLASGKRCSAWFHCALQMV